MNKHKILTIAKGSTCFDFSKSFGINYIISS